jgi:hypothetical protein
MNTHPATAAEIIHPEVRQLHNSIKANFASMDRALDRLQRRCSVAAVEPESHHPAIKFRCPPALATRLAAHMAAKGITNQAEAIRRLLDAGLLRSGF